MKVLRKILAIAFVMMSGMLLIPNTSFAQSVGISGTAITPDAESILELRSTTKGVLLPRLTATQRIALTAAPLGAGDEGLTIFNTSTDRYNYWDGGQWIEMATSSSVTGLTLDDAYDAGGSGTGKTITADAGAVEINGPDGLFVNGNVGVGISPTMKFEVTGGNMGLQGTRAFVVGGWSTNTPDVTPDAQLVLDGAHNAGYNLGGTKLLIRGIDNESNTKAISVVDENSNELFYLTSQPTGAGLSYFRGNVGIGTTTVPQKLTIGATGAVFGVDNTAYFQAKNNAGTYENYFWPRWSDNIMYMNFGSGGMHIRNNSSATAMFMTNGLSVGLGTTSPAEDFHVYRPDSDIARVYATGGAQGSGMFYAGQSASYGGGFVYDGDGTPALVGGTDRITFFRRNNNTDTDVMSYGYSSSTVRMSSLAGSGNRLVIANASGDLTASSSLVGSGLGDNLGDHTATANLNMTNREIDNINYADIRAANGYGMRFWGSNNYKIHMGNATEYRYGPVQDYSIKTNMNNDSDRGWTWGIVGSTTNAAALSTEGHMSLRGTLFLDCVECGNTGTAYPNTGSGWGDMAIQGRVLSTNSNLHLSPPDGFNVIINDTYRAGGGSASGSNDAGLIVEGSAAIGQTSLNSSYRLIVNGRFRSTGINETSDARLKKNVKKIGSALNDVLKMQGVTYEWKADEFPEMNFSEGTEYGLLAQELEKVLPDLVDTDEEGYKSIQYTHLVPVLIEAIKELKGIIAIQQEDIDELKFKAEANSK